MILAWLLACSTDPDSQPPVDTAPDQDDEVIDGPTYEGLQVGALVFEELPENLLILSVDTLRKDRIDRWGSHDWMPKLTSRLEQGVVLDAHRSCSSWTYHAFTCLMSGQYAVELGWVPISGDEPVAAPAQDYLPAWLTAAGFQTRLLTTVTFLKPDYGLTAGYEQAAIFDVNEDAGDVAAEGLALWEQFDQDQPWALHLHFMDPHLPWFPPDGYRDELEAVGEVTDALKTGDGWYQLTAGYPQKSDEERAELDAWMAAGYGGEMRYLDDALEELFVSYEAAGVLDDTLVLLVADHGEQLYERGGFTHPAHLYQEETAGVVALWAPGLDPLAWAGPTTHADVAPTVLAALGVDVPASVTGAIVGEAPTDRPLYTSLAKAQLSAQTVELDGLRLLYQWTGELKAFDLDADPQELADIRDPDDPDQQALEVLLEQEVERLEAIYTDYERVPW